MTIIQVRLAPDKTEGKYGNYFNYEFGIDTALGVTFSGNRYHYSVSDTEVKTITRI